VPDPSPGIQDLRFWALIISSVLGLIYLLLVPLHFSNVYAQSNQALEQINQKASQAETQLEAQTKQVDELIKNPQRLAELDKAIASGQVQGEQLARLQALKQQLDTFKKDPKALSSQVDTAKKQISTGKQDAENRAKTEALKLGLRTGLSSLFLAIGFIAVGWTGLRSLGG
jgi:response regulator of citrate/malate metabolism